MGDLVQSERSPSVEHLHERFNAAVDHHNLLCKDCLASPLTITLGDEFQGLALSLQSALQIAQALRFQLLADGIECRFAIGLVEPRTPVNPDRAWNMMGPGLARTRTKLNEKRAPSLYRFAVTDDPVLEAALEALGAGVTMIERRWTGQQREDITALIAGTSPADIARQRNVSVHTIYKVRASGDYDTYVMQWRAIKNILTHIDMLHEMTGCQPFFMQSPTRRLLSGY